MNAARPEMQTSSGTLIVLGCGNGAGTPAIGNNWGKCDPAEPRNRRTRASVVVRGAGKTLLVDTGPDLREQMNRHDIADVDAVLYTHAHADHVHGIDELTSLSRIHKRKYAAYGDRETMAEIQTSFSYMFESKVGFYPAVIEGHILEMGVPVRFGALTVLPFAQDHGTRLSTGFRVGDMAYSTDMKRLPEESLSALRGIDTWIVDAAGYLQEDNPVHANLREVFAYNERIGARRVVLTHLARNMDYRAVSADLPEGCELAYDGMEIEFSLRHERP